MTRSFYLVLAGSAVSVVGDGVATVALMWWVLTTTGSPVLMSTVALVATLGSVVSGPFAGVLADRFDRRRLMVLVDITRAGAYGALGWLALAGDLGLGSILVLSALARVAGSFYEPAFMASMPAMVERNSLERANSYFMTIASLGSLAGPALGGVVYAVAGLDWSLWADAASFAVSGAALLLARFASPKREDRAGGVAGYLADLRGGFRYLRSDSMVLTVMSISSALNLFANMAMVLIPVLVQFQLHAGSTWYGVLDGAWAGGMAVGALATPWLARRLRPGRRLEWWLFLAVGGFLVIGFSHSVWLDLAVLVAMGGAFSVPNVAVPTVMQRRIPAELQGRVWSAAMALNLGLTPVGQAGGGFLGGVFGPAVGFYVGGGGMWAFMLPILRLRGWDEFKRQFREMGASAPLADGGAGVAAADVHAGGGAGVADAGNISAAGDA